MHQWSQSSKSINLGVQVKPEVSSVVRYFHSAFWWVHDTGLVLLKFLLAVM